MSQRPGPGLPESMVAGIKNPATPAAGAVQRLYTRRARSYVAHVQVFGHRQGLCAVLARTGVLVPGQRILDAGCGTGLSTLALASAVHRRGLWPNRVHGFDLTPAMLGRCRATLQRTATPAVASVAPLPQPGSPPSPSTATRGNTAGSTSAITSSRPQPVPTSAHELPSAQAGLPAGGRAYPEPPARPTEGGAASQGEQPVRQPGDAAC